jgi:hypothetical protein
VARFGIRVWNRNSSIAAISSVDTLNCIRSVRSGGDSVPPASLALVLPGRLAITPPEKCEKKSSAAQKSSGWRGGIVAAAPTFVACFERNSLTLCGSGKFKFSSLIRRHPTANRVITDRTMAQAKGSLSTYQRPRSAFWSLLLELEATGKPAAHPGLETQLRGLKPVGHGTSLLVVSVKTPSHARAIDVAKFRTLPI